MSYDLVIWDPARHAPVPTSSAEALTMMDGLRDQPDSPNPRLAAFATTLATSVGNASSAASCKTASYRLSLAEENVRQIADVVHAAAEHCLVVYDDEIGMCFLPDGTIYPEDSREMWTNMLAELNADPATEAARPDGRTWLQRIAGELFDAIGRK